MRWHHSIITIRQRWHTEQQVTNEKGWIEMKEYEKVEMEIIVFEDEEIIITSGDTDLPFVP